MRPQGHAYIIPHKRPLLGCSHTARPRWPILRLKATLCSRCPRCRFFGRAEPTRCRGSRRWTGMSQHASRAGEGKGSRRAGLRRGVQAEAAPRPPCTAGHEDVLGRRAPAYERHRSAGFSARRTLAKAAGSAAATYGLPQRPSSSGQSRSRHRQCAHLPRERELPSPSNHEPPTGRSTALARRPRPRLRRRSNRRSGRHCRFQAWPSPQMFARGDRPHDHRLIVLHPQDRLSKWRAANCALSDGPAFLCRRLQPAPSPRYVHRQAKATPLRLSRRRRFRYDPLKSDRGEGASPRNSGRAWPNQ